MDHDQSHDQSTAAEESAESIPETIWRCFALPEGERKAVEIEREEAQDHLARGAQIWLDVEAPQDADVAWLGETFGFHELALTDILNNDVRPKQELFDDVHFTVFSAVNLNPGEDKLDTINLNIFLTEQYLVTAHTKPLKTIHQVAKSMMRRDCPLMRGTDYVYYFLLDGVINRYLDIVDDIEERLQDIERRVFDTNPQPVQEEIFAEKRRLAFLRRSIGAKRDALRELVYGNTPQIKSETRTLLRDVLDHVLRINDTVESYRELANGLMDSYMSQISHRMNEVMKLLSIIATIMLPLSFLTGVFGMNFEILPGIHFEYGFHVLTGFMIVLVAALAWYFRRKGIF